MLAAAPATGQAQGPDPDPAPATQGPRPDPAPQGPITSAPATTAPAPATPAPATPTPAPVSRTPVAPVRKATPAPAARTRTPAPAVTRPAPATTQPETTPRREAGRRTHHSERSKPKPSAADRQRAVPYPERAYEPAYGRKSGVVSSPSPSLSPPRSVGSAGGGSADARLILQLGMLFSLVYVAFLCVWFRATRHLRGDGEEPAFALVTRRVRAAWRKAFAGSGSRPQRPAPGRRDGPAPAEADAQWTCEIAYQPGKLRFQAVMAPDGDANERSADTKVLHWPRGVTKASARELETAMGAMFASIAAAGWEPVHPGAGVWSERRFVWRKAGEPPTNFELVGPGPVGAEADAKRPAPPRAPRGANREAVLRTVAARPGLTLRELTSATGVKPSSLPPLLRTLTRRGELEKRRLPNGQTGYALARHTEAPAEAGKELQAAP